MDLSRRVFLGASAVALSAQGANTIPHRTLGLTGAEVSILAFGCGSRFLRYQDDAAADAAIGRALDLGITYFDTAADYGDGLSERRLGAALKARKANVWIATKVDERDGDSAMRTFEQSLKNLQKDRVDLVHIHSLTTTDDLSKIEAKGGVLERLYRLRDQKSIRAVGISCHTDPSVLKTALERHDFDCTQMALNGARQGMAALDADPHGSFESLALPVAKRKNMGVIAMKIFAQDKLQGKASAEKLIRYSLSLPVTAAVIGMPTIEQLAANAAITKEFKPLSAGEMSEISTALSGSYKAGIDTYFTNHADA